MLATDKEVVDMIKWAAVFMGDTLNDVLSMQKIEEEGKMELKLVPFNIRNSIIKIVSALSAPAIINHQEPEYQAGGHHGRTCLLGGRCVPRSNLLCNAIKFSPQDGTIYMEAISQIIPITETSTSSAGVPVSISDEGPGIAAENKKKLLTGFFQIRPDQLQQGKGSGLGLALCKQIVNLCNGTIGMHSVEGQGSTFHFCIRFGISIPWNTELVEEKQDVLKVTSPTASIRASTNDQNNYLH